jgi:polyhydroxyalkanoate synthase
MPNPYNFSNLNGLNGNGATTPTLSPQMQAQVSGMQAMGAAMQPWLQNPEALLAKQLELAQGYMSIGANVLASLLGHSVEAVIKPAKGDNRFTNEAWNHGIFDLLKQSYLLTNEWLMDMAGHGPRGSEGLDARTRQMALLHTRNLIESMSPSNFFVTNPEVIATAISTKGESIRQGMQNLMEDMQKGKISLTDTSKFHVGKPGEGGIAVTPGTVVYRNKLIELIQYTPTTKQVHQKPLLICPPWINRYYILDLSPNNSLTKHLVDQGFTVFMISWKNPDASYRDVGFENYMTDGLIQAADVVMDITGEKSVNTLGYCIGGTMLAITAAILNAKGDKRLNACSFLTTMTDYTNPGELGVFTDEAQLDALDAQMARDGILDGKSMAGTFSAMRSADLMWAYVTSNYLLGKQPLPFDILYWNDDSTCMPYAMHSWYLRNLYLNNKIAQPGALTLLNTPLDITNISQPLYMVGALSDHITPWLSTFAGFSRMQSKSKRYALTRAGHVAGVVSPPTAPGKPVKRSYWTGSVPAGGNGNGQQWLETAHENPDSWWADYVEWLGQQSGEMVAAPSKAGNATYKGLEAAPGQYVLEH